jgi:hypothetical protein
VAKSRVEWLKEEWSGLKKSGVAKSRVEWEKEEWSGLK